MFGRISRDFPARRADSFPARRHPNTNFLVVPG